MIRILRMILLCGLCVSRPQILPDTVFIPVQIEGGGMVSAVCQDSDSERLFRINDQEQGRLDFSIEKPGIYVYTLSQRALDESYASDQRVYILKIEAGENGRIESAVLYESGSDEKAARAVWHNTPKETPVTGDVSYAGIYFLISMLSLFVSGVLFQCAKGGDDED